jgi:predicted TIM-barrel fold metal-dependent hydrolase
MSNKNMNSKENKKISRRDFMKNASTALIGVGIGGVVASCGDTSHPSISKAIKTKKDAEQKTNTNIKVIDVHRHCLTQPSSALEGMMKSLFKYRIDWEEEKDYTTVTVDGITSIAYSDLMDVDAQVKGQNEAGVTKSLLSGSMFLETLCQKMLFVPDEELNKRLNDATARLVAKYPEKLEFMVNINPFDTSSIKECERCFEELGAKGINIGTSWNGEFLDSPQLDYFWEYVQDKDVALFLHPPLVPIGYHKMNAYKLEEMVGRPFDTTMTVSRMIFSGVFDRYPRLKMVIPHMGGALPNVVGRLDFGYRLGYKGLPQGQAAVCERMPSEYLKMNLYVDTMGFSPAGIRHCIELFGADRVLFGSDYAAVPISPKEHIDIVKGLGLSQEDEEKILWKNASSLFRLV